MGNILRGVKQALEAIRIETEAADWQLRLEILQLILSTSESVVATARKKDETNRAKNLRENRAARERDAAAASPPTTTTTPPPRAFRAAGGACAAG